MYVCSLTYSYAQWQSVPGSNGIDQIYIKGKIGVGGNMYNLNPESTIHIMGNTPDGNDLPSLRFRSTKIDYPHTFCPTWWEVYLDQKENCGGSQYLHIRAGDQDGLDDSPLNRSRMTFSHKSVSVGVNNIKPNNVLDVGGNLSVGFNSYDGTPNIQAPNEGLIVKGKTGLGLPDPGSQLSIRNNVSVGDDYALLAAPANSMIVQGKVGIGTDNPGAARLRVQDGAQIIDNPNGNDALYIKAGNLQNISNGVTAISAQTFGGDEATVLSFVGVSNSNQLGNGVTGANISVRHGYQSYGLLVNNGSSDLPINVVNHGAFINTIRPAVTNLGVRSVAANATTNYGVKGTATGGSFSSNYGVWGTATGATNTNPGTTGQNYAIFGETYDPGFSNTTSWAGYFNGRVYAAGNGWQGSDLKLKKNVNELSIKSIALKSIKPMSYEYDKSKFPQIGFENGIQFGFIAQELEEHFPNLVTQVTHPAYYDSTGKKIHEAVTFKAVNYTGLIPVLWSVVQQQQAEIEKLKELTSTAKPDGIHIKAVSVLHQNKPNPFSENTEIAFELAEGFTQAAIYIYNMNGLQIQKHDIAKAGMGKLVVEGRSLKAGMYLYSLIVDGKEVDTKRMILTK
jgi:hypothetical protein